MGRMVSCLWKLHFISEHIVGRRPENGIRYDNLRARAPSIRFGPHPAVGARCRSELRKTFVALKTCSQVCTSTANTVTEGEHESGDWNRSRNFPTGVGAVAEVHEPHFTDDILVSSDEDGVTANRAPCLSDDQRWRIVKQKIAGLLSNAQKHSQQIQQIRHSLGVDFGDVKTGVSISLKGYAPRPLLVVRMRGDKLIEHLMDIAAREKVDEFIVGLPRSSTGEETAQSNKTRSFAGRLAGQAALRGWRVYLQDEYGSSQDGLDYMLEMGVKKRSRKEMIDAYAAVVLLSTYFGSKGALAQLVVPKGLDAQELVCLDSNFSVKDTDERVEGYDSDEDDNYEYED